MMIQDKGLQEQLSNIKSIDELKSLQIQYSKSKISNNALNLGGNSTNMDTDASKSRMRGLGHSPTMQASLNSNLILPELHKNQSNFMFGVNQKINYDEISDI